MNAQPNAAAASAKQAINEAMALLQRRWTLRVLWELSLASMTFRALQGRCDEISPTVLNQRLAELREAGLVERGVSGYALTALGAQLVTAFAPLSKWAVRWKRARERDANR
jgi:DNA-binding HxlR family transcriptional regulator